jgi:probable HAF family extracellular repeat protein
MRRLFGLCAALAVLLLPPRAPAGYLVTDLGSLGPYGRVTGINNSGQVVGSAQTGSGASHAFLYSGGVMTNLGTLGGDSYANAVNDSGQVAGASYTPSGVVHPVVYSGGTLQDLGTLGGVSTANSYASGINTSGQVVGATTTAGGGVHAFLHSGGKMTDLGSLAGDTYAKAVNASGQVVGLSSLGSSSITHAFLYSGGKMMDLNALLPPDLGVTLAWASGINDRGQIAAQGSNGHGYLLTPDSVAATPEPGGLTLLALGAAGLLAAYRRRSRR